MDKKDKYETLCAQIKSLVEGEKNVIGVLSNVSSIMHETFPERYFWVGFYLVKGEVLVLAPCQGPVACTRIRYGKGVCGTAWKEAVTQLVPDVDAFPGHIACSSLSRSEIVVPVMVDDKVWGVLDVDSEALAFFDETDKKYLEYLCDEIVAKVTK